MTAYATIDEVTAAFDDPPTDTGRLAYLTDLIDEASAELDMEVGHDFAKHPTSSTETRTFHGSGSGRICVHDGIVSVTTLEVADSVGGTFTTIPSGDYFLEQIYPEPDHPYDHLTLSTAGTVRTTYPPLQKVVRITGVFGFATVPTVVKAAVIDRVRQLYSAQPALDGSSIGPSEFGRPTIQAALPDRMYRVVRKYRGRFFCHV